MLLPAALKACSASRPAIAWAKRNQELSGLSDRPVRFLLDDVVKFVQREVRRGNRYQACAGAEQLAIFDAAMKYKADGTPLLVIAGAGSSATDKAIDYNFYVGQASAVGNIAAASKDTRAAAYAQAHQTLMAAVGARLWSSIFMICWRLKPCAAPKV